MPSFAYTGSGAMARSGTLAVSNVSQQVVDSAIARTILLLYNNGSQTVFVGPLAVTTSNGFPIKPGEHFETRLTGAVYAICATGAGDLRYWDEYKPTPM